MMTGELDPLEAQLRKLKPQPMSAELRGRIAGGISASARTRARILRGTLMALAAVLLASVTVVVAVRGPAPTENVPVPERQPVSGTTAAQPAERGPLLAARQLAKAETIDQIDAVLDQYAPRWLVFTETDRDVLAAPDL